MNDRIATTESPLSLAADFAKIGGLPKELAKVLRKWTRATHEWQHSVYLRSLPTGGGINKLSVQVTDGHKMLRAEFLTELPTGTYRIKQNGDCAELDVLTGEDWPAVFGHEAMWQQRSKAAGHWGVDPALLAAACEVAEALIKCAVRESPNRGAKSRQSAEMRHRLEIKLGDELEPMTINCGPVSMLIMPCKL